MSSKYELSLDLMKDREVDLIKDFLKIKGYKRTLECLIKEERYKNIEDRNLKVIYTIFNNLILLFLF
jgi:hypothetical protein